MGDVTIGVGRSASAFNVFFWVADYQGCGYIRCALPGIYMQKEGWNVSAESVIQDRHLYSDLVVAQRTCLPGPSEILEVMRQCGMPVIFEMDDDLFYPDPANERAYQFYHNKEIRGRLRRNIELANAVMVTTPRLAREMRNYNPRVYVVPNYLDRGIFDVLPVDRRPQNLIIGYAGGPSHMGDIKIAENAIQQALRANENTLFHSIGHDFGEAMSLSEEKRLFTPWTTNTVDYYEKINFDIGIAPLAKTRFNECKSPIKAMEYGALGIPIVASKFGPYEDYVKHGETGFLCKNTDQWIKALRALINDEDMRVEMGHNGMVQAAQHIQDEHITDRMKIFKDIIDEAPAPAQEIGDAICAELLRRAGE